MTAIFGVPPQDKKDYISQLGKVLVARHGKKKFYSIVDVIDADDEIEYINQQDIPWWGISVFCSFPAFMELYKREFGPEVKEPEKSYLQLKVESLADFTVNSVIEESLSELDLSHLNVETAWFELEDMSESLFDGLGDFFGDILGGIFS